MRNQHAQLPLSHEELLRRIGSVEHAIPQMQCRVVPTSFDPDDPTLCAFPLSSSWQWKSLEAFMRISGSRGVLSRIPLFWQMESPLFEVCRTAGAIFFQNDIANMQLGAAALRGMHMDTVLTCTKDALDFSAFLAEAGLRPHSWFIVHSAFETSWELPGLGDATFMAREVHLFPGVPLLEQCDAIAESKEPMFHHSDAFTFESAGNSTIIATKDGALFPIERCEIPLPLRTHGTCTCGRALVSRAQ